jgi:hypothetical protein
MESGWECRRPAGSSTACSDRGEWGSIARWSGEKRRDCKGGARERLANSSRAGRSQASGRRGSASTAIACAGDDREVPIQGPLFATNSQTGHDSAASPAEATECACGQSVPAGAVARAISCPALVLWSVSWLFSEWSSGCTSCMPSVTHSRSPSRAIPLLLRILLCLVAALTRVISLPLVFARTDTFRRVIFVWVGDPSHTHWLSPAHKRPRITWTPRGRKRNHDGGGTEPARRGSRVREQTVNPLGGHHGPLVSVAVLTNDAGA